MVYGNVKSSKAKIMQDFARNALANAGMDLAHNNEEDQAAIDELLNDWAYVSKSVAAAAEKMGAGNVDIFIDMIEDDPMPFFGVLREVAYQEVK